MKSTSCWAPGTVVSGKYWCFAGFQWTFAILAPSGKACRCRERRPCRPRSSRLDHHRIGEDHRDRPVVLARGDDLPAFVSSEGGEGEPARHLQGVLVLLGKGDAAQGGEPHAKRGG